MAALPSTRTHTHTHTHTTHTCRSLVFPPYFSPAVCDLLDRLLQLEPDQRLGCGPLGKGQLKQHPWFGDIKWDALAEHK